MATDYARVEKAIAFLETNYRRQPELREVAGSVGLSEYHFQRLFRRWAGISPKRFLQFLTADHAKRLLRERRPVLDVAYSVGLSGPGRLHDLLVNVEAVTPGELKAAGEGLRIRWGIHDSPFGRVLLATTERGVCALEFVGEGGDADAAAELAARWPAAELVQDAEGTRAVADAVFGGGGAGEGPAISLYLRGTNFQVKVWEALLRIPAGHVATYGDVARAVGDAGAARAVGTAVGQNPVAFLIPCHRVIRGTGAFGEYRWGAARKRAILGWEAAHDEAERARA